MTSTKSIHSLVLDANPLLRNDPPISTLLAQSRNLYTVPAVIEEIRDQAARTRIQTTVLPFLSLRTPKVASVKLITDFARRTGDLEVLSRPDLQILALAYELEVERNEGDWRLRSTPGQARTNGPIPEGLDARQRKESEEAGVGQSTRHDVGTVTRLEWKDVIGAGIGEQKTEITDAVEAKVDTEAIEKKEDIVQSSNGAHVATTTERDNPIRASVSNIETLMVATTLSAPHADTSVEESSDISDSDGWITPSNLKVHQEADKIDTTPMPDPQTMQVATITTDYAMQNILLRMNLNLLSPSLMRIKQLKSYILRCHACFTTTKDMTRQFCKKCGGATLLRTSCSTDANGNFKIHLKKNMQWNNRGNVFSIPKPTAGSSNGKRSIGGGQGHWGMNLILAEDQPEYQKLVTEEKRRKNKDLMDEDYLPDILSGARRGPQGRIKVGGGRNINSKKRH